MNEQTPKPNLDPAHAQELPGMVDAPIVSQNEPSLAKIQLRPELAFSLRSSNEKPFMMVHDERQSQYYRLGVNEWKIAKLLDGRRTMRQVFAEAKELLGEENASPEEVMRLSQWLLQSGLAIVAEGSLKPESTPQTPQAAGHLWLDPLNKTAQLGKWNPLFLKMSLPNPQPLLKLLEPALSWLFSRHFLLIWIVVCCSGVYSVLSQWTRFRSSLQDVFATENWLYLMLVWIVLKVLHEAGHAIACMRYGGQVTRCGLMFIVFSPIAWVDVTSSWSFRSKWRRIIVSAAGMYIEFLVAAVAAIVWARTHDPVVATISRNVVISASVTTLLFNLNFLMRFDGYYILSDLIDIQNLYQAGQQYLQYFQRRYILGIAAARPSFSNMKLAFVRAYGFGAMLWRVTFCVGILLVAASLFRGAGIVLAVFSGVIWFAIPFVRFLFTLWHGIGGEKPNTTRLAAIGLVSATAIAIALLLPWPGQTVAHGVVEYSPLQTIRANSPGFVRTIAVSPGQQVIAGTVLMTLDNREITRELADIDLQIKVQQIARRISHRDNEMAQYETIDKKLESLAEQRTQLATKVDSLTVVAPIDGTIIAHNLESLEGKYVESGFELLAVGSTGEKEVRISIEQKDIHIFRETENQQVRLAISGHALPNNHAELERVNPRATRRVLHPSLAGTTGGPLAVQQNNDATTDDSILLVDPHFEGVVAVPTSLSNELRAGEPCRVSLGRGHVRVYEKLVAFARSYFDAKSGANS